MTNTYIKLFILNLFATAHTFSAGRIWFTIWVPHLRIWYFRSVQNAGKAN